MKDIKTNRMIIIDNELITKISSFGIIAIISKVAIGTSNPYLQKELNIAIEKIRFKFSNVDLRQVREISNIRNIMISLGRDANRYLNSAESLVKRIANDKSLPSINNIVDFNNYLSIKYLIPVGTYDLDKIDGEIVLRCGNETDVYNSLSKDNFSLNNLPVLSDNISAFGSIVSDSKRTLINQDTRNILTVLFFVEKIHISEICNTLNELFSKAIGAEVINITKYE